MKSIAARLLAMIPWGRVASSSPDTASGGAQAVPLANSPGQAPAPAAGAFPQVAGSEPGWLRVLSAEQLLATVQASKAIQEIWRQSRQSQEVWARDLLPAIYRYAEFVQLMPASEAHHHAHAGGLLSHTIEMLLAAVTWRNAHLLPGGTEIEEIDAQRDQWTYVVFFAALLHDIAKPMTDLRIQWRCDGMADAIRWAPTGGSLVQIAGKRAAPEYLVDFAPKSQRDYGAHARLAHVLLPRIAPESALQFLACTPQALDALEKYLSAQDRDSLVAQIVRRADKLSTQRALLSGHKARFATAKAVPLIDLLMQAITSMLRTGTTLPLNRSGAAGWVYEGAVWFVAKRLADSVREWIKTHEPDEAVPGEAKNDRLFDTWQEYGAIELNPATSQAIWYVTVHGSSEDGGEGAEQGGYVHELAMLRFPLAKLFSDATKYPAPMRGRLELRDRRKTDGADAQASTAPQLQIPASPSNGQEPAPASHQAPEIASASDVSMLRQPGSALDAKPEGKSAKIASIMREPAFKKPPAQEPKPAATPARPAENAPGSAAPKPQAAHAPPAAAHAPQTPKPAPIIRTAQAAPQPAPAAVPAPAPAQPPKIDPEEAAYLVDDSDFLDPFESAAALRRQDKKPKASSPPTPLAVGAPASSQSFEHGAGQVPDAGASQRAEQNETPPTPQRGNDPVQPSHGSVSAEFRRFFDELDELPAIMPRTAPQSVSPAPAEPQPVLLVQQLPRLATDQDKPAPQPSELALAFMRWVQQSLVSRELTYNEPGAAVHFVEQGMALVSPLIFRMYARETEDGDQAQDLGARVQREVIKCGWHLPAANRTNIVRYAIHSRGGVAGHLSCVVLVEPSRWVQPVPPSNPALKMV